jgi:hypothetical protein
MSFDFGMFHPYLKPMKAMGITTSINKICTTLHGGKINLIPNWICLHWIFYIVFAPYPSCLCLQPWHAYFAKDHFSHCVMPFQSCAQFVMLPLLIWRGWGWVNARSIQHMQQNPNLDVTFRFVQCLTICGNVWFHLCIIEMHGYYKLPLKHYD